MMIKSILKIMVFIMYCIFFDVYESVEYGLNI